MCFGNDSNDLEMLAWAGVGVAVRGGLQAAINTADAVTPVSAIQQEWSLIARDLEAPRSVAAT